MTGYCIGDIICLKTLSNITIIINDEALIVELLEKRASETSDRARNVFVREMYVSKPIQVITHYQSYTDLCG